MFVLILEHNLQTKGEKSYGSLKSARGWSWGRGGGGGTVEEKKTSTHSPIHRVKSLASNRHIFGTGDNCLFC